MYAVIQTGGKQYRVEEGSKIRVEKLSGNVGDKVELREVLFIGGIDTPKIGRPLLPDSKVVAEIVRQDKSDKVLVFKRKRRKGFKKIKGHRQPFTELKV
ncbi:MAG: 50S ribosomal protein L21, partial [Deltaproteobacteria bacterium]|nr:50S ribosomal protein L21 [Deltaproteobacteria bacterium]